MSTFDGVVKEFPKIRIDYFRVHPKEIPPSACFLSHVHSDHLQGLETLKMPFVYCSAASKRLLLKIEKYPHRINFTKGILETRKQHYRHLKLVLRALPLQTPVELDLDPKTKIRVTLFDANHCPGSVMFLIEGQGNAILYTGDIRAEPWFVNSIIQSPIFLPYTNGSKRLDCLYLDTTFALPDKSYRSFPSKREGLDELMQKVSKYPADTIFYFKAWTIGYENVWLTLSQTLNSRVHVDEYQFRLFQSLSEYGPDGYGTSEGWPLIGFTVGNQKHSGCLTREHNVKVHSCEPGSVCYVNISKNKHVVWIRPIISRLDDGTELREPGAGGSMGNSYQTADLDVNDTATMQALKSICTDFIEDTELLVKVQTAITNALKFGSLRVPIDGVDSDTVKEIAFKDFANVIAHQHELISVLPRPAKDFNLPKEDGGENPSFINFPYSRHSSYMELQHLVSLFRPKDICPCTVELESWTEAMSMQSLFGDLCCEKVFYYDQQVRDEIDMRNELTSYAMMRKRKREESISQEHDTESTDVEEDTQETCSND